MALTPPISQGRPTVQPEVFTKTAGLVLLAPFLETYFERLGLLKDGVFDRHQLPRAPYLLHAMVGGDHATGEDDLHLERLLCAVHITRPLETEPPRTQTEIDLANDLLAAVISQWSALGETSVEGLQEAFLRREGRLHRTKAQGPATLLVASGPYDMLLERLPWSFSPIQSPRMPSPLTVKWR